MECSLPPKDQGGLGIHDLEVKNTTSLGKCLFKLIIEDGICQTFLTKKNIGLNALLQVYLNLGIHIFWLV
jgi:hypothetical protein